MMDLSLIRIAAIACKEAYKKNIDLGQAEYWFSQVSYQHRPLQVLAMPGSNETKDWFWNALLTSTDGVKQCTYEAVEAVHKVIIDLIDPDITLLVTGHSKAGPDALQWMNKYKADYCVAFAPPPAFRRSDRPCLNNTVIVTDPDDAVPNLGCISFCQPACERFYLPKNRKWWDIRRFWTEHSMDHIINNLK